MVGMWLYIKSSRDINKTSYMQVSLRIHHFRDISYIESKNFWIEFFPNVKLRRLKVGRMKLLPHLSTFIFIILIVIFGMAQGFPASDPEAAIENMRQIPQWHCLRYRKFDLVRRCRNYRLSRKH